MSESFYPDGRDLSKLTFSKGSLRAFATSLLESDVDDTKENRAWALEAAEDYFEGDLDEGEGFPEKDLAYVMDLMRRATVVVTLPGDDEEAA